MEALNLATGATGFLGRRLKDVRRARGATLQQVAESAGLSKSFISQIESGVANPSIASLKKIGDFLDIPLGELFTDEQQTPTDQSTTAAPTEDVDISVVREDNRRMIVWPNGDRSFLLVPDLRRALEIMLTQFEPRSTGGGDELYSHGVGEEFVHVIEGSIEVTVEGEVILLQAGDSMSFPSHRAHTLRNPADAPARIFSVTTPPSF